ncbi:hypothetical protein PC129_g8225 [Phytophthora cactorum]|uniref:Uncharacterized protein n=1 Tax=Phytophthora cactorum TaxID=29920 RepID=A0A329T154_9STRA|nr:hypothetical protein Pcac1_g17494 [Phytophthora cactorum]KAG2828194.1 hypothetical protein PC112_g8555 [Phytophthora cactorum]KAG2830431.1 hypothetical protein PC111_g7393 [Phytophthora cactorum]KAG2863660.1 hypothetical protein PC113_g5256 [Phytophthora cactorum]KAG2921455.1 hypothetical protein PC114_g5680 [Phytophthora cactorum]
MQKHKETTIALDTTSLTRPPSRRNNSLEPLGTRGEPDVNNQVGMTPSPHGRRRMTSAIGTGVHPTPINSQKLPHKYMIEGGERVRKRLSSIVSSKRSSSRKMALLHPHKYPHPVFNNIHDDREHSEENNSDSDSSDDGMTPGVADVRHRAQFFKSLIGPTTYEDGGLVTKGHVDHRGITPHVVFSTTHTPPSVAKNPVITCNQPVTCGFCSSTNLSWILRCSFCGSARMSDAPRLKYLIDMILSIDPRIKPDNLAKRILDYAKFDRVALKAEATFKQAGLVRAKAAIMMMNRTVSTLRFQIMRMIFVAWKNAKASGLREQAIIQRCISIKQAQTKRKCRQDAFAVWRGYVARVTDERLQRFQVAFKRNELTKLRRIWGSWRSFLRIRGKEKAEETRRHYEDELRDTPLEAQKEIDRLKEIQQETLKLVFTAGDSILELLQVSLRKADHSVLKTLQLVQMYPTTAGEFFESAHGNELLDALSSGHAMPQIDGFGLDDEKDDETMRHLLDQTIEQIEQSPPSDSLMQWINFQRRRGAEMGTISESPTKGTVDGGSTSEKPSSAKTKIRLKDKKKEFKPIKYLQDLRAVIASPGVMLKLLCHTSAEAQAEYDRIRSTELTNTATIAAENSTTATTLSPSAQVQLRSYFKIVPRILNLPPDIVARDSFVLNDFDSLYAYTVYLYLFHPNYVAPGMVLSPRYHLSYSFLTPQWQKVKTSLQENECDPFAQQQFYIFLSKLKRINLQFLRFIDICKAVRHIASWHERCVTREAFNDFSRRVLCKDSNISVSLEKETLASWVSLPASKLMSLCDGEDEFRKIEQVYKDNVLDLIKIFRIYGSAAGGKGILEQEFLKVMTKAGVTNKKNILRSHLQLIYQQSRQSNGENPSTGASITQGTTGAEGEEEAEDRGATPNEFFEALTRVAYHNYQKRREFMGQIATMMNMGDEVSMETINGSGSLLACVIDLVVDKVVPLTKKFQEQGLTFKKQMIYPDVQHVCKAQEKKLKRVFISYSQRNKNPQSRGKLLDLSDFESLLKDRRLIDALFPHGRIKQLVAFVQQDGEIGNTASSINGYDADSEFVFSEFVEALAAIAVYRNANPYLPFAKKLETFFEEYF